VLDVASIWHSLCRTHRLQSTLALGTQALTSSSTGNCRQPLHGGLLPFVGGRATNVSVCRMFERQNTHKTWAVSAMLTTTEHSECASSCVLYYASTHKLKHADTCVQKCMEHPDNRDYYAGMLQEEAEYVKEQEEMQRLQDAEEQRLHEVTASASASQTGEGSESDKELPSEKR
jgi:hypothetical protein